VREACFAVQAQRHDAAGDAHRGPLGLKLGGRHIGVARYDLGGRGGRIEAMGIGLVAQRLDFRELLLPLQVLIERFKRQGGGPFVCLGS